MNKYGHLIGQTMTFSHFLVYIFLFSAVNTDFSEVGREYILDRHNSLRSRIALATLKARNETKGPASNMIKLKWDSKLEKTAQKFSNSCPFGHSSNRDDVGENLFWWTSSAIIDINMDLLGNYSSNMWENEFQLYEWKQNLMTERLFSTGIGHATQMAWATTERIGCGVSRCTGKKSEGIRYSVVCQYSPAGNVIESEIYKSGLTCSKCPRGSVCESDTGLCVF